MHSFSTPADMTLTVLRTDTVNKAQSPDAFAESDKNATSFDVFFHAPSNRPDQSETVSVATLPGTEGEDGAKAKARGGKDEMRGADDTPMTHEPETGPDVRQHAETAEDDTPRRPFGKTVSASSQDSPDRDPRKDETDKGPMAAALVPGHLITGQAEPIRRESAGRAHAATPDLVADRVTSPTPPQAFAVPAAAASHSADATARPIQMRPTSDLADMRTGSRGDAHAGTQTRTVRGREDTRMPVSSSAPVLVTAGASPAIQGFGADGASAKITLSSMLTGGARVDGADSGRDPDAPLGLEPRGTTGSSLTSSTLAALPRSDLSQTMAMQIAAAIQKGGPGMKSGIELRLSPEELGIVRLTFTQSETGVTVNVQAERAETLELLRRHIDTLAQEFLDIGYESANFTFDRQEDGAEDTAQPVRLNDRGAAPGNPQTTPDTLNSTVLISDRLDIRL